MQFRGFQSVLIVAVLAAAAPIGQADARAEKRINWDRIDLAAERRSIAVYQNFDQHLQNVGWKLARANAEFCENAIPSVGLQMQDMASYGSPDIARRALGLEQNFAVQTAAKGSPAARSPALRVNREITHIGALSANALSAGKRFDWERLKLAHDHLDRELAQNRSVTITFADGEKTTIEPVQVCATRFELIGEGQKAVADGSRVVIGIEFPAFDYGEAEFAAVVAHELAHNLLGHTAWLDRNGRKRSHTRMTESEADRLMPWLLINAGYDPEGAARFLKEFRPSSGAMLFVGGSHPRWRERVEAVETEIAQIRKILREDGKADWRAHFRREIDPLLGLKR